MKKYLLTLFLIVLLITPLKVYAGTTPNKIVNHDDIASVSSYMDDVNVRNALSNQKWLFTHASVGENMKSGMVALRSGDARYVLGMNNVSSVSTGVITSNGNIYEVNRGNPGIQSKLDIFTSAFNTYGWASKVNIAMNKYCYIDIRDLSSSITVEDMPTYANQYINSIQALESSYPGVTFVYMTVPTTNASGLGTARIYAFNQLIRNYASSSGKYLLDVADIEAYDPSGVHQVGNYSGYTLEMLYSGYTTDGGHPATTIGQQRLALGWYAMAISIAYNKNQVSETPTVVNVTGITVSPTTMDLVIGESKTITPTITPADATNKGITWTSSDNSIATVTNGVVKGIKAGSVTITANTVDGNKKATVAVTVKAVAVTGVTASPTTASLSVGDSMSITATIAPTNATNKSVTWTSSDNSIATVTNGVIKGIKVGSATITVTTADGSKKATVTVTVKAVAVTGVTLNMTSTDLIIGDSKTITATIAPSNATNKSITWTSSDNSVVTVSNGVVKGIKAGSATITATTADGNKKAIAAVTVKAIDVSSIVINNKDVTSLEVGKTLKLTTTIEPTNATNKAVTWTSSNNNIATVDNTGLVKALNNGTVTITVTTKDKSKVDEISIEITVPIEIVNIKEVESTNLDIGSKIKLNANSESSGSTNTKYVWESSDNEIATVNQDGIVSGKKTGTVTITLKTEDNKVYDEIVLNIVEEKASPRTEEEKKLSLIPILIGTGIVALSSIITIIMCIVIRKKRAK